MSEFFIADTFTDSLGKLTGDEQKTVKTTAFESGARAGTTLQTIARNRGFQAWDCLCHLPQVCEEKLCLFTGHPGHGPLYLWNAAIGAKRYAKNLKLGTEMEKSLEETDNHRRFQQLCRKIVAINEQIFALRPARIIEEQSGLDELKKKLQQQQFMAKCKKNRVYCQPVQ